MANDLYPTDDPRTKPWSVPCACGGKVVVMKHERVDEAVRRHQHTPRHQMWLLDGGPDKMTARPEGDKR